MNDNFKDVGAFHHKFDLEHTACSSMACPVNEPGPKEVSTGLLEFRLKFLLEELKEIGEACGYELGPALHGRDVEFFVVDEKPIDHAKAFDGLLDLAYVTFGMAHVLGYPWQAGWDEVQRANITKERCGIDHVYYAANLTDDGSCHYMYGALETKNNKPRRCGQPKAAHSVRGSAYDVIKPAGWAPPDIGAVLRQHGFQV